MAKTRPGQRSRVIYVAVGQPSIRCPRNLLRLPELGKETRDLVIDLWSIGRYYDEMIEKTRLIVVIQRPLRCGCLAAVSTYV